MAAVRVCPLWVESGRSPMAAIGQKRTLVPPTSGEIRPRAPSCRWLDIADRLWLARQRDTGADQHHARRSERVECLAEH